mmetsp:Transcript_32966/g.51424  ORF Transcript_32966/g.51424 Transcript_32966/m.51424 type:complete len:82 (-) Transcript_32966:83-328(-)
MKMLRRMNVENNFLNSIPDSILMDTELENLKVKGNNIDLKKLSGIDSYLQRKKRRVIEDGQVHSFSALEIRHQRERQRRNL